MLLLSRHTVCYLYMSYSKTSFSILFFRRNRLVLSRCSSLPDALLPWSSFFLNTLYILEIWYRYQFVFVAKISIMTYVHSLLDVTFALSTFSNHPVHYQHKCPLSGCRNGSNTSLSSKHCSVGMVHFFLKHPVHGRNFILFPIRFHWPNLPIVTFFLIAISVVLLTTNFWHTLYTTTDL